VPAVRLVPRFARQAGELSPAQPLAGNQAPEEELRLVSAALLTCEDAIARAQANGAGTGVGLRGGSVTVASRALGYHLSLHDVHWTEDVAVSGDIDWPGRSGMVHATVDLQASHGLRGKLELQWPEGVASARATVSGTLGAHTVAAEAPAP
jgi:hypothetical protein